MSKAQKYFRTQLLSYLETGMHQKAPKLTYPVPSWVQFNALGYRKTMFNTPIHQLNWRNFFTEKDYILNRWEYLTAKITLRYHYGQMFSWKAYVPWVVTFGLIYMHYSTHSKFTAMYAFH
ncbi:MAG: hypothetical protein MHM6MM_004565 [Cercozoa sp. M6MM]